MPIMALEEKNKDNKKPMDNKPLRGLLIKSFKKEMMAPLFSSPGIMLRIRLYNSNSNCRLMGKKGTRVNKKIREGGMAITKLKETAAARSLIPTVFTCLKKNSITSNKGMPWKPGGFHFLLPRITNFTGGEVSSHRLKKRKKVAICVKNDFNVNDCCLNYWAAVESAAACLALVLRVNSSWKSLAYFK